jgi:thiamine-phosphate pyrophosphorylase
MPMPVRQPSRHLIPKIWLMTDPRLGDRLLAAIRRLPKGSGVILRHYQLAEKERQTLFAKTRRICTRRGHRLLLAGPERLARRWHADGFHGRTAGRVGLHSAPVHNRREIAEAKRLGAALVFLSPLYATRSHPFARPLGLVRFNQLAKLAHPAKVIALGGMTRNRARSLDAQMVHGWAAIDAFRK